MNEEEWVGLCNKHETDKCNLSEFYSERLEEYRSRPIKILEIGVLHGNSLLLFNEYFDNAQLYGLDCGELWKGRLPDDIKVFQGRQSDVGVLWDIYEEAGTFDIIIDDGSHLVKDIIASFEFFKDKFNCLYIIEDTSLTLHGRYYEILNEENFCYMSNLSEENDFSLLQDRNFYDDYWSRRIRELDSQGEKLFHHITFYHNLVCIDK